MKLYRYIRALEKKEDKKENEEMISEKLIDCLEKSKINFSHPASFNDPLECIIPIKINDKHKKEYMDSVEKILSEIIGRKEDATDRNKRIYEAIEYGIRMEHCLISCFSLRRNNQLMWSHYADQHRGICLCYDIPDTKEIFVTRAKPSESIERSMRDWGMDLIGSAVSYETKRPSLYIEDEQSDVKEWRIKNDCDIKSAIFIKPRVWGYEKEWRMALTLPFGGKCAFAAGIKPEQYYYTIPRDWLREVTFGLRLDSNYCCQIIDCLRKNGYSGVKLTRAALANDKFKIVSRRFKL